LFTQCESTNWGSFKPPCYFTMQTLAFINKNHLSGLHMESQVFPLTRCPVDSASEGIVQKFSPYRIVPTYLPPSDHTMVQWLPANLPSKSNTSANTPQWIYLSSSALRSRPFAPVVSLSLGHSLSLPVRACRTAYFNENFAG